MAEPFHGALARDDDVEMLGDAMVGGVGAIFGDREDGRACWMVLTWKSCWTVALVGFLVMRLGWRGEMGLGQRVVKVEQVVVDEEGLLVAAPGRMT
jgi:hypothetical protein